MKTDANSQILTEARRLLVSDPSGASCVKYLAGRKLSPAEQDRYFELADYLTWIEPPLGMAPVCP